jgi:predicted deacetylase
MLIVSVSVGCESDVSGCATLAAELAARSVPVSWLFPPRPDRGRHRRDGELVGWLRRRLAAGDALVQHGFGPAGVPYPRPVLARRWSGELAGLPGHEAALRLIPALRTLDELGLRSTAFAPPRWHASEGTVRALRAAGFRVCAEASGVRLLGRVPAADRVLRGRVLGIGTGRGGRVWAVRRAEVVRLHADAGELSTRAGRRALVDAVDGWLAVGATPATYPHPLPTTGLAA